MNVFSVPTISAATFGAVLSQAASPVLAERPAAEYYRAITGYGLDPAFMLSIFAHESKYGTNPAAVVSRYGTKNWGNTRSLSLTGGVPVYVDTDRGRFVKFASWLVGLHDACNRLVSPSYPYAKAGAKTVETIIPLWAPNGDQDNNAAAYVRAVLDLMAGYATLERGSALQFADQVKLLTVGANRPGTKLNGFHAFTVHETDNEASGANALMHYGYINSDRPNKPSFHICADSGQSLQFLPVDELGWHIGDGADQPFHDEAFYTVGGEICVNSRAGFPAACRKMAASAAAVLNYYGKTVQDGVTVRQHGSYWSAENSGVHRGCPKHLRANDWGVSWSQFVGMVQAAWDALQPVQAQEAVVKATPAPTGEADALKAFSDAIPFAYRGALVREGDADLSAFGGSVVERVCYFERLITHRLKGASYVMTLATFVDLKNSGKIRAYPNFAY